MRFRGTKIVNGPSLATGADRGASPYPLTEATAAQLLGNSFRLLSDETVVTKSVPVYQGMEHWEEW